MSPQRNPARVWLALFVFLFGINPVHAGDWEITPSISVESTFSDNIRLDDNDKESDIVLAVTPAISVHGEGRRIKADIDYEMQNAAFLNNSDANSIFHQLDAKASAELAKNRAFVDVTSTIGQVVIDSAAPIPVGNLNISGNQSNFYRYGLSPYLKPHFGGYADGLLRYRYDQVNFEEGASDAEINSFDAGLVSGRKFGPLSWSADYNYSDQRRDTAADARFENADGIARYAISNRFSLVASGGYANNDYETSTTIENGSYWAAGGFLQPSRYYSIEAQQGKNLSSATLGLYPTRRTSMLVTYRDREVGLNPGEVWSGSFSHYTRRSSWSARYEEETTTEQALILQGGGFLTIGIDPITGEVFPNPQPGDLTVNIPIAPFASLTDEVIERKRASATFGLKMGKTGLRVTVFDEEGLYLTTLREERTRGISGSLNRRLAPRTNGILSGSYQRIDDLNTNLEDILVYTNAELTRRMSPRVTGSLAYRFSMRDSLDQNRVYTENRIEARLTMLF